MTFSPENVTQSAPPGTTLTTVFSSQPTSDIQIAADDPAYWFANIPKRGIAAFNANPSGYKVFRNVKDYGAKGKFFSLLGPEHHG
jgi:glucan 1,3-beta-glucosidase